MVRTDFDPHVWSGRALQVDFAKLAVAVLHQCIRPLIGAFAPGHYGYQRACVLINGQASTGHVGHQCSQAPGRPNLHLVSTSRRPRQVRVVNLATSSRFPHLMFSGSAIKQVGRWRSTLPRSPDHGPGQTKRCGPACWPTRSPSGGLKLSVRRRRLNALIGLKAVADAPLGS
jgi:hypothetical protein